MIRDAWRDAERAAAATGCSLFPGPLCRLIRYQRDSSRFQLQLGPTDYREYLGTSRNWIRISQQFPGNGVTRYLANPLAVCAVVHTTDRKLVLARRSSRTMEHPGYWHFPAGHVDPRQHLFGARVNVFKAALDELFEETGCQGELGSTVCLGLVRFRTTMKPELVFSVAVPHTSAAFKESLLNEEHDQLRFIPDTAESILELLSTSSNSLVPIGRTALSLYASWRHGHTSGFHW
jgi:8-oxo-dGTP pyrophosphatase MutT (NUDIX family)